MAKSDCSIAATRPMTPVIVVKGSAIPVQHSKKQNRPPDYKRNKILLFSLVDDGGGVEALYRGANLSPVAMQASFLKG